jgi:hypothetical protein
MALPLTDAVALHCLRIGALSPEIRRQWRNTGRRRFSSVLFSRLLRLVRIKGVMDGASRQHPGLLWPMLHLFWRCGEQVRLVGAGRLQGSGVASLFHPARRRERAHGPVTSSWRSANWLVKGVAADLRVTGLDHEGDPVLIYKKVLRHHVSGPFYRRASIPCTTPS